MSDQRPSGGEIGGAAELLASARQRIAVARADLTLPPGLRLTEWQRTTIADLLSGLVRSVEDELRASLAGQPGIAANDPLHAAFSSAHVEIAGPILHGRPALCDTMLLGALIRRTEEHRLHKAASADHALLLELAGDSDEAVAGEAMALLIAQSARLDPFQEPVMARTELAAEVEHGLVWTVAAALRSYMVERHDVDPAAADEALELAARGVFAGYDEGETIEARSMRLARRLEAAGRLDDRLVSRMLAEAGLPLFLAAAATRTGLDYDAAWEIVSDARGHGAALLLRAADIGRVEAGAVLFRLVEAEERVAAQLDLFDANSVGDARRMLSLWRVDPGYRFAIARLAEMRAA